MNMTGRGLLATDDPGMQTWVRFLQAHAAVTRRLEAELQGECDISLAEYEALLQLELAGDGQLRMSELASGLLLSRSGVTRLVDRLEAGGDVERRTCPSDARGSFAVITDVGRARLRAAEPVHLRGVREHFLARIPEDEIEPLGRTMGRLAPADAERDALCRAATGAPGPAAPPDPVASHR
jgi:DNA-binding MarR family transcriptional regulator